METNIKIKMEMKMKMNIKMEMKMKMKKAKAKDACWICCFATRKCGPVWWQISFSLASTRRVKTFKSSLQFKSAEGETF